MSERRSYRQLCALARALDVVGERWTLLIVRNLLVGPQRYSELMAGLPGITTNLLAKRLEQLQSDGLVIREPSAGRTRVYALSEAGRALEPALFALAGWAEAHAGPVARPGDLDKRLRWGLLAMRRRYRGGFEGCVVLEVEGGRGERHVIEADGETLEILEHQRREAELTLRGPELGLGQVLLTGADPDALGVEVEGTRRALRRLIRSVR